MKISSAFSTHKDSSTAISDICQSLRKVVVGDCSLLIVCMSARHDPSVVLARLSKTFPKTAIIGGSSCIAVMSEAGFHSEDGYAMSVLALQDEKGQYGVGIRRIMDSPKDAAYLALKDALKDSDRPFEVPAVICCVQRPGFEEEVLEGFRALIGPNVPVIGGSTADNNLDGSWYQFDRTHIHSDSVAVSVLFPSTSVGYAFRGGYGPSSHQGVVTKASRNIIYEIDDVPAAQVYNHWCDQLLDSALKNKKSSAVFLKTSGYPLGWQVKHPDSLPRYLLTHPKTVTPEHALVCFSAVPEGVTVSLMHDSKDGLDKRLETVLQSAISGLENPDFIEGALIFCGAGNMLRQRQEMAPIIQNIKKLLGQKPFVGSFTFGEQGVFFPGQNHHGNHMIAAIVFSR